MSLLTNNPKLGHITTFGGHPVIAAAALATLRVLFDSDLMEQTRQKEMLLRELLIHEDIKEIRGRGLMLALIMKNQETADHLVLNGMKKGILLFWLLYEPRAVRITPPLTISNEEIRKGCNIILDMLNFRK